jgi:hypothetical protein
MKGNIYEGRYHSNLVLMLEQKSNIYHGVSADEE